MYNIFIDLYRVSPNKSVSVACTKIVGENYLQRSMNFNWSGLMRSEKTTLLYVYM